MTATAVPITEAVDGFLAAWFVLAGLGVMVARQMRGVIYLFVFNALALTGSAAVIAVASGTFHLAWVAGVTFVTKVIAVPAVLVWATGERFYERREVDQVLSIPVTVLLAALLALIAWVVSLPLVHADHQPFVSINVPTGLTAILFGACTVAVRREAVVQLMGLLVMESGAFFASIALISRLSILAEIATALDVPMAVLVIGLLIRSVQTVTGHTRVGLLSRLKESGR